jgi:hypothetical protein
MGLGLSLTQTRPGPALLSCHFEVDQRVTESDTHRTSDAGYLSCTLNSTQLSERPSASPYPENPQGAVLSVVLHYWDTAYPSPNPVPPLQTTPLHPHVDDIERRIFELNNVPRLQRLGIYILHVVRMEDARAGAREDGLFARGVGKAETAPTVGPESAYCQKGKENTDDKNKGHVPGLLCRRAHNGN